MRNLTMLTDFYELTMMNGYLETGLDKKQAVFDLFYRGGIEISYAISCGLSQAIDYINNLHFENEDIEYLRSLNLFGERFLQKLKDFKFTGDIYAMREGEVIFPMEPILTVKAPLFEAQLVETALLNIINHQTLIASKAARISETAKGVVSEFGLRRAQGPDAGIYGARAAIIGGCAMTSNVLACQMFDLKVSGTHAHSWIMSFPDELTAFRAYAKLYPNNCILLIDTYDTLKSGIVNAITVFDEMKADGKSPIAIRLDSGDLAYLSKEVRKILDKAGHKDIKIFASGDIDENILMSLNAQNAAIDSYGIGTKLITSYTNPALGGVYKLAAIEENGKLIPKLKVSDTPQKITNPGFKTVYRIYNNENKTVADLITLFEEEIDSQAPLTIFHPEYSWKRMTIENYTVKKLHVPVFLNGKQVYNSPSVNEIAKYCKQSRDEFYEEYRRLAYPHIYKVDLSDKLYDLKNELLTKKY